MSSFDRRSFLKGTAGSLLAATLLPGTMGAAPVFPKATDVRTLGKTGLQCSYLGIGTGVRGRGKGITDLTMKMTGQQILDLLEYAYQKGITYFDMADQYGSHNFMREALKKSIPRDKVMLLSKVWSREPEQARHDIDRMRKELDTDCIDVLLMHCIRESEDNWPETLRPLMDVFSEAKSKGWIKAHGLSCHNLKALQRVADEPWVDVVLSRINPYGVRMDGPPEAVVPVLEKIHQAGKGVLGMKILGEGDPNVVAKMDESLKFVAGLGSVDAMTIGFLSTKELDEVMGRISAVGVA